MIEVQELSKYYNKTKAIDNVNFKINEGEIIGILGLNGAGKTTIIKILTGLLTPSAGKIRINNLDLFVNNREIRKQIGYLPDVPPLYNNMTTEAFLKFVGKINGLKSKELNSQFEYVVEHTAIKSVLNKLISHLSHGYKQRVGIAQALISNPPILIFDEPIHGLDPAQIIDMRNTIKQLGGKHTVLLSSHILHEISETCDRIFVIHNGKLMIEGTEEELSAKLSTQQRIEVIVRGNKDNIHNVLKNIEHVDNIELIEDNNDNNIHRYHLVSKSNNDIRENIAKTIINNQLGLLKIDRTKMELESIFMKLIETKESDYVTKHISNN